VADMSLSRCQPERHEEVITGKEIIGIEIEVGLIEDMTAVIGAIATKAVDLVVEVVTIIQSTEDIQNLEVVRRALNDREQVLVLVTNGSLADTLFVIVLAVDRNLVTDSLESNLLLNHNLY